RTSGHRTTTKLVLPPYAGMNAGASGHPIAPSKAHGVQHALLCKNAPLALARATVRHDAVLAHTRYSAVAPPAFFLNSLLTKGNNEVGAFPMTRDNLNIELDIEGNRTLGHNTLSSLAIS